MKDFLDRLRQSPEYVEIDLLGEKRGFILSIRGMRLARSKGVDPVKPMMSFALRLGQAFREADKDARMIEVVASALASEDLENLAIIVWWGCLPFDEDLTLEEVEMGLTLGTLIRSGQQVIQRITAYTRDSLPQDGFTEGDDDEEEDEEGN